MGCGEFLVKYVLFFANLAFALAGLALLGLGLAVHLQFADIETVLSETSFRVAPVACMIVGGIAFIIAFFGCCGAIRESNCMLVTYAIFMLVLMALKLTLGVMVFVNLDGVVAAIPNWMNKTFQQDQDTFHVIEHRFSCCGPTGPGSYLSLTLPNTCCSTTPCTVINAYAGCTEVLQALFNNYGVAIGSVAIVIAAIELVAVIFALCLANHARNKIEEVALLILV
ncbi:tetraspanin E118 [Bombyx mori]|uniref:Tetraspanin n=1 Tax=Bombyx mori TaxID=7091 RepID=Q1HQ39_BOMMO|nr:tetraspanin E118 [Bombyx mori]ABF51302.1 tetraspanin E118 [Bombyx mori]